MPSIARHNAIRPTLLALTSVLLAPACVDILGYGEPVTLAQKPDAQAGDDAAAAPDAKADGPTCDQLSGRLVGGHCYYFLGGSSSQPASLKGCEAAGGHLVTITSKEEQDLVLSLVAADTWIGLVAPPESFEAALFHWVTGEPTTVTYWAEKQPDDGSGCVVVSKSEQLWRDRLCDEPSPALCERE